MLVRAGGRKGSRRRGGGRVERECGMGVGVGRGRAGGRGGVGARGWWIWAGDLEEGAMREVRDGAVLRECGGG